MADPKLFGWCRQTGTQRKRLARARIRYAHVSVLVGWERDPKTGLQIPTRTPKGKGSTAKRAAAHVPESWDDI